jgi:Glycosyl hydrolase family 12
MLRIRPAIVAVAGIMLGVGCVACGGSSGGTAAPAAGAAGAMCQPYQTKAVDGGRYTIQDDEWGSSAAECVSPDGGTGFAVTKSEIAKSADGDPGSYPSLYAGCNWGSCTKGGLTAHPQLLDSMAPGSVTTSLATTDPSGGAYDVSYDIWLNKAPTTSGAPDGLEVMVWLNNHGGVQPAGSVVASGVQIGGYTYDVWYSTNAGNGPCVTYEMTSTRSAVTNLDLYPLLLDAGNRGYANASWYLIAVEAGFEIWNGGAGLTANSFSVTLKTPSS